MELVGAQLERVVRSSRTIMKQYIINTLLAIATVFAPAKAMLITCLALVVMDLITGIMASKKAGKPITSSGIRRTIAKLLIYEVTIALAFLTQTYLTGESIPVASIISGIVGLTELTSCLENLNTLSGGDLLKSIIDKLGSTNQTKP